jgi:hypothetical protein
MRKHRVLILTVVILTILTILSYKGCRNFLTPHYIDNSAVTVNEKLYSPDSSIFVLYYTLDVGAVGYRDYKSVLRQKDLTNDLSLYNLPPQIIIIKWLDNETLLVKHDTNEIYRVGANASELELYKDTIPINSIKLIVTERVPLRPYLQ